ncbi:hypothetical protein CPY51_01710 [Rhizobium tubonense]|uniref:Plasmid stabilization protein n=2 Tax=Rhizobium tubonense TaxID=484088 RepID=A0A2W4D4A1_9HYPH|nr:hypothetical protein CPY51_01710 [Rhizobium tubonense]
MYEYIADDDPIAANRLLRQINAKIESIARSGFSGSPRDWLLAGLKAVPYRNRCIYFLLEENNIHVVRILHGRQDIAPEDFTESSI